MKIKRFLWGLAPVANLFFIAMESALGGGAFYTLKTGRHLGVAADVSAPVPDFSWWWDFVPAIGIGTAGPFCAAMVLSKVIVDLTLPKKLQRTFKAVFWYYTLAYTTCGMIYVLSQPDHMTFPQTLAKYNLEAFTPLLIWWLLSANFILPGTLLAAMAYDARVDAVAKQQAEQEKATKEKRERVRALGEDAVKILDGFHDSPHMSLTRKGIELMTGLSYTAVNKAVHDLVECGKLDGDVDQRGAKFMLSEDN